MRKSIASQDVGVSVKLERTLDCFCDYFFLGIGINCEKYTAQTIHDTALASLHEEFATVII